MSNEQLIDHGNILPLKLNPGENAPRYERKVKKLITKQAIITEQATQNNLPIVDFQVMDEQGNEYFFVLTGRIINTLSAAIKGVNLRNHGVEEP